MPDKLRTVAVLSLPDGELAYAEHGSGPPLVVIHGPGAHGDVWAADVADLAADHRLITYCRRGYPGSSPSPRNWSAHANDAAALIRALAAAPATVVSHGAAAIPALELATRRPEVVASLVLLDPFAYAKRNVTPRFLWRYAFVQLQRRLGSDERAMDAWFRFITSYSTGGSAYEREDFPEERRTVLRRNAPGIFADLSAGGGSHIDPELLGAIECPVVIAEAELSPALFHRSARCLARRMPQAEHRVIAGAGHVLAFDRKDELLELLRYAASRAVAQES